MRKSRVLVIRIVPVCNAPKGSRVSGAVIGVVVGVAPASRGTLLRQLEFRVVRVVRRAVVGGDCRDARGDRAYCQVEGESHRVLRKRRASYVLSVIAHRGEETPVVAGRRDRDLPVHVLRV